MQRITAHYKFEGDKFQKHPPTLLLSTIVRRPLNISFLNLLFENMTKNGQDKYLWHPRDVKRKDYLFHYLRIIKSRKLKKGTFRQIKK